MSTCNIKTPKQKNGSLNEIQRFNKCCTEKYKGSDYHNRVLKSRAMLVKAMADVINGIRLNTLPLTQQI